MQNFLFHTYLESRFVIASNNFGKFALNFVCIRFSQNTQKWNAEGEIPNIHILNCKKSLKNRKNKSQTKVFNLKLDWTSLLKLIIGDSFWQHPISCFNICWNNVSSYNSDYSDFPEIGSFSEFANSAYVISDKFSFSVLEYWVVPLLKTKIKNWWKFW